MPYSQYPELINALAEAIGSGNQQQIHSALSDLLAKCDLPLEHNAKLTLRPLEGARKIDDQFTEIPSQSDTQFGDIQNIFNQHFTNIENNVNIDASTKVTNNLPDVTEVVNYNVSLEIRNGDNVAVVVEGDTYFYGDVYVDQSIYIQEDVYIGDDLTVGDTITTNKLIVNGQTLVKQLVYFQTTAAFTQDDTSVTGNIITQYGFGDAHTDTSGRTFLNMTTSSGDEHYFGDSGDFGYAYYNPAGDNFVIIDFECAS